MSRKKPLGPKLVQLELFPDYKPPAWHYPKVPDGCFLHPTSCFTCPFPDCVLSTSGPGSRGERRGG